jgi:hypothetical protein
MTHRAQIATIPAHLMNPTSRLQVVLFLAALNLKEDATFTAYRDWCDKVGVPVLRSDIDSLCGTDFNVS